MKDATTTADHPSRRSLANSRRTRLSLSVAGVVAIVLASAALGIPACAGVQNEQYPLAPPDLSSPRDSLTNFLSVMNDAYVTWKSESGTAGDRAEREAIARIAQQFFDLSDIAPTVRKNVGRETAVYMKEVLDRVELPAWEQIPDDAEIAAKPLNQWTIPQTEITLVRLKDGLREGQWVFSSETDERVADFYERAKRLPYKPGASEGLHELFVSEPGWMIPRSWIRALPQWMGARYGGQAVWQWGALGLTLLVTAALMAIIYAITARWSRRQKGAAYYIAAVFPIFAVILPQWAIEFLSDQVFITGRLFEMLDFALDLVSLGALVVVILGVTNRLANALMALPWSTERQLTAQLAQLIVRTFGVTAALITVFEGGRYLGVPLTTLVAGVSVSGLTVALAAQDTLKNLFGSLMILLDRPFQVGDLIRIKGHQGRVESVGLRSTRIRNTSGHVVSIPNEEMARLDSMNISSSNNLRRQEILRLRTDTPPQKIRELAQFIREMLDAHDAIDKTPAPSVRVGFADDAVMITMTYFYASQSSAASAAVNEAITLRVLERLQAQGIRFTRGAPSLGPGRGSQSGESE